MSKKPLLFGDKTFDAERLDDVAFAEDNWDYSYVPGYSEQRRENELLVKDGKKATPIDKLYWARVGGVDGGTPDYRQRVGTQRLGYRACTVEDLKERGWAFPPAAYEAADGTIRRDDLALAIVDNARAEKNRVRQEHINAEFHGTQRLAADNIKSLSRVDGRVQDLSDAERVFAQDDAKQTKRRSR